MKRPRTTLLACLTRTVAALSLSLSLSLSFSSLCWTRSALGGAKPPAGEVKESRRGGAERSFIEGPCAGLGELPQRSAIASLPAGEELDYELTVHGVHVGRLETKIGRPRDVGGRRVIPLFGRARANSFVASIKPFEGRYQSLVEPTTLRPIGMRLEATYGDDRRWERASFLANGHRLTSQFRLEGRESERAYESTHALTDMLTLFYAARTIAMTPGLEACQDVFGGRRMWRMEASVAAPTRVSTPAGAKMATTVRARFDRKPYPGLDNQKRPWFEIDLYLSTDRHQAPLGFVVRMPEVTAEGQLRRWLLAGRSAAHRESAAEAEWLEWSADGSTVD